MTANAQRRRNRSRAMTWEHEGGLTGLRVLARFAGFPDAHFAEYLQRPLRERYNKRGHVRAWIEHKKLHPELKIPDDWLLWANTPKQFLAQGSFTSAGRMSSNTKPFMLLPRAPDEIRGIEYHHLITDDLSA